MKNVKTFNEIIAPPSTGLFKCVVLAQIFLLALTIGQGIAAAEINVANLGASGNGSDATEVIQEAINTASVSGDTVYIPAGTYGISSTLTISNTMGVRIMGDGMLATMLQPTNALAGQPVLRFVDAMHCTVEAMSILGDTNAPPSAGIESDTQTGGEATHLTVRDVHIGSLSVASIVDGISFVAGLNDDANNDMGFFENVMIYNYTHAGYSFVGANSLVHTIIGGIVGYGPIGVYTEGGSFKMTGTHFDGVTQADFDFENLINSSLTSYQHPIDIVNVSSESGSGSLLTTGTDPMYISMTNLDEKFAPNSDPVINFQSAGVLYLSNSQLYMLGTSDSLNFSGGTSQVVSLTNNYFNLSSMSVSGHLLSTGNCWQGNPTITKASGALVTESNDLCGTFNTVSSASTKKKK
ncbi:MAG TPA: glycosyl hydrolase family 28-related protein [Candidatus Binataceae bacterium]|nr:glycosyl hydrolase family 28-related protein [Candidatus Binataceae bacterium]